MPTDGFIGEGEFEVELAGAPGFFLGFSPSLAKVRKPDNIVVEVFVYPYDGMKNPIRLEMVTETLKHITSFSKPVVNYISDPNWPEHQGAYEVSVLTIGPTGDIGTDNGAPFAVRVRGVEQIPDQV